MTLLDIEGLKTTFYTKEGVVKAVDQVNLEIKEGEKLAIIGETGSGKSVLGLSILRLLPDNAKVRGKILFKDENILEMVPEEMRKIRGKHIALIPQNPGTSLNPVLNVGYQVKDAVANFNGRVGKKAMEKVVELFKSTNLPRPKRLVRKYPHQLSGGMKQRVLFSIGIAGSPDMIIADEPTKGLDAPIRARIVKLLEKISSNPSLLLITHDLKATKICDKIAVMYAGEIVEYGRTEEILESPQHPYTQGLIQSLPENGLIPIEGASPSLISLPNGCRFHPRCQKAQRECSKGHPELITSDGHSWRCFTA